MIKNLFYIGTIIVAILVTVTVVVIARLYIPDSQNALLGLWTNRANGTRWLIRPANSNQGTLEVCALQDDDSDHNNGYIACTLKPHPWGLSRFGLWRVDPIAWTGSVVFHPVYNLLRWTGQQGLQQESVWER